MSRKSPRLLRILRVRYRKTLARLDHHTPEWMRWITPYGTSIVAHGAVLIILGVFVFINTEKRPDDLALDANFPQQLREDELITAREADTAGDPFATEKTPEPPSLTLDPDPRKDAAPTVPQLTPTFQLAALVNTNAGIEPLSFAEVSKTSKKPGDTGGPISAPFAGRDLARKGSSNTIRKFGGTVRSEKAVQSGLEWVVRHQRDDGGWSLDCTHQCKNKPPCPKTPTMDTDTGATGLALLPLLGAGHIHNDPSSKYSTNVKKGIDWLVKHQKPDGDLFVGGTGITQMYSHALATMALCEAFAISGDEALKLPAQKGIDFIIASRCTTGVGGWRYTPGMEGDTCVFGWQMFALRSAALAGLKVPNSVVESCRSYLDEAAADPLKATYCYSPAENKGASIIMTAEGLLCRQYLGWPRDDPAMLQGAGMVFENLQRMAKMGIAEQARNNFRNIYYWYYATQLLHNLQGPAWEEWNATVREWLVKSQEHSKGCDDASWSPTRPINDFWGAQVGRHFLTCLSLLTLEVYYRYLPLYSEGDRDVADVLKAANPRGRSKDEKSNTARDAAEKLDRERAAKDKAGKDKPERDAAVKDEAMKGEAMKEK